MAIASASSLNPAAASGCRAGRRRQGPGGEAACQRQGVSARSDVRALVGEHFHRRDNTTGRAGASFSDLIGAGGGPSAVACNGATGIGGPWLTSRAPRGSGSRPTEPSSARKRTCASRCQAR